MVVRPPRLLRAELERECTAVLRRGGWKAGLWLTRRDGQSLMIKDVRQSNPLFRWCFGRWFLWHECNMYGYMRESDFVPKVAGWLDGDAFAIEMIDDAITLGKFKRPALTIEFYQRLQSCVDRMHDMGVVHLDLRSRRNILVTGEGRPMLVDFGSALFIGRSWLSRRILVPLLSIVDNSAIVKFRYRDFPDTLSRPQRLRYLALRTWRILWPWPTLWRAMGVNRRLKRGVAQTTGERQAAMNGEAHQRDERTERREPVLSDTASRSTANVS